MGFGGGLGEVMEGGLGFVGEGGEEGEVSKVSSSH